MTLEKCFNCGSDDIETEFPSGVQVCAECEVRHSWFDDAWHCADPDGVRSIRAAEAMVPDEFDN